MGQKRDCTATQGVGKHSRPQELHACHKTPGSRLFRFPLAIKQGAETGESEKMQHGCSCDQSFLLFIYSAQLLQSSAYRAYLETPAAQRKDATKQMVEEGVVY